VNKVPSKSNIDLEVADIALAHNKLSEKETILCQFIGNNIMPLNWKIH
jgi:hypothetical protein